MKTFPKPLTAEDEKYYLQRHEEGDKKARQILIEYNLRLVAHIAKKYQTTEDDMEELISIGTVGLIKAVDTFDHEKASKLATYAARCVENEILMYMRVKRNCSENPLIMSLSVRIKKEMKYAFWISWKAESLRHWIRSG